MSSSGISVLAPAAFVLLWSTGFIGAKLGLPHAEPLTFLSIRFVAAIALMAIWILASRAPWPDASQCRAQLVVGALLHGVYLGGVFTAIWLGVEAGVAALIVCLQPLLSAVLARAMLGERLTRVQVLGLGLGFAGAGLVVSRKLSGDIGDLGGLALCLAALLGISLATILQKRSGSEAPMRSGTLVQYVGAVAVVLPLALIFEEGKVAWTGEFVFALGWLVVVLSIGAVSLLMVLIRRGEASKVASLFFLVPPCTALFAWMLFGETLGWLALLGMGIAIVGVALTMRGGVSAQPR